MKILTSDQIRQADAYTIKNEPVSSIDLMERAGRKCYDWISSKIEKTHGIIIFCGLGNNGGDGLVIARMLHKSGYKVVVNVLKYSEKFSADFAKNYSRLKKEEGIKIYELTESSALPEIKENDVVIDAVFGSGLTKPISDGFLSDIIQAINKSEAFTISIDLPSGLFSENNSGNNFKNIVNAHVTLSLQLPKLAFLFPENYNFSGEWVMLDIGLDQEFIAGLDSPYHYMEERDIRIMLKHRRRFSHKGNFGHAGLFSGSLGKTGAAVLSAKACVRSGAGLLTAHIPGCGYQILQTSVPEAMCSIDEHQEILSMLPDISKYNAIAIGPGIGQKIETENMMKLLIQNSSVPVIFDADAVNILAENKTWLSFLPKGSILTPHPGEFSRLAGKTSDSIQRLEIQKEFSVKFGIYIIYKGAFSTISTPDGRFFFNSTGNPGMATGGSGDVLTGILLGLKASGYSSFETCLIGTYIHGLSGDIAADQKGEVSLIAGDIIENIPNAFKTLIVS